MSEPKHTPGPWTYSLRSDTAEIMQPGGMNVAFLPLRLLDVNTSMADARLIAAAPDLLKSAKDVIAWALKHDRGHEGSELLEILGDTQRAIDKAEGEQ